MKPMNAVTKRLVIALGAAVLVSVAFILVRNNASNAPAQKKPTMIEFKDEAAGFSVSLPGSWQNLTETSQDPLVRLLAGPPATDDTLRVKVIVLPGRVVLSSLSLPLSANNRITLSKLSNSSPIFSLNPSHQSGPVPNT